MEEGTNLLNFLALKKMKVLQNVDDILFVYFACPCLFVVLQRNTEVLLSLPYILET